MANYIEELLKRQMEMRNQSRAPVQSEVPGALMALLTQGNQNTQPDYSGMMSLMQPKMQAPDLPQPQQYQGGSGIGRGIVENLLGEWFDERKYKKNQERFVEQQALQQEDLSKILASGKKGEELYYSLLTSRSPEAQKVGAEALEKGFNPEKTKIVEMGVEGHPELRQQGLFDLATKQLIPIGPYWKPQSGVTVNTGNMDNIIKDTEAKNMVDAQGNAVKIPVGMTRQQAADQGLMYGNPPGQTETKADISMQTTDDLLTNIRTLREQGVTVSGIDGALLGLRSNADPVGVAVNTVMDKAGYKINPKNAELASNVKNFGNYALQIMRGAQVGPQEQARFEQALPTAGQPDEIFNANLDLAEKIFRDAMAKAQSSSGRDVTNSKSSQESSAPQITKEQALEELRRRGRI